MFTGKLAREGCPRCGLDYLDCICDLTEHRDYLCLSCHDDPDECKRLGVCDDSERDWREDVYG